MLKSSTSEGVYLIAWHCASDGLFKSLPCQILMLIYRINMVSTGIGELGFYSGEGA